MLGFLPCHVNVIPWCVQRFRKRNLPVGYATDLTPVVAAKEAGASWNGRQMGEIACKLESAVDFARRKE
jgi:hypothetical protein